MNGRLIEGRRLELGLSRGDVSKSSGLSWAMLTALEHAGEPPFLNPPRAGSLKSSAIDLNTIAGGALASPAASDDVRLEALLAGTREAHSEAELAFAMQWPLQRVIDAIERLDQRLTPTGQAVQRRETGIRLIVRGPLAHRDTGRLRSLRTTPTKRQAELLRIVLTGTSYERSWDAFDAEQRSDAAALFELGFVYAGSEVRAPVLAPSADARFSLEPRYDELAPRSVAASRPTPAQSTTAPTAADSRRQQPAA